MTASDDSQDGPERAAATIAAVELLVGRACPRCARVLCGHDAVLSLVLGYKHRPLCSLCLAAELSEARRDLCERCLQWILRRDCFLAAWHWASAREGWPDALRPPCLWTDSATREATARTPLPSRTSTPSDALAATATDAPDAHWDAGDMGCGDLVLALRQRLRALPPGSVLALRATDSGAPQDIPAWCGLTGHTLLRADHPRYLIQRKPD